MLLDLYPLLDWVPVELYGKSRGNSFDILGPYDPNDWLRSYHLRPRMASGSADPIRAFHLLQGRAWATSSASAMAALVSNLAGSSVGRSVDHATIAEVGATHLLSARSSDVGAAAGLLTKRVELSGRSDGVSVDRLHVAQGRVLLLAGTSLGSGSSSGAVTLVCALEGTSAGFGADFLGQKRGLFTRYGSRITR